MDIFIYIYIYKSGEILENAYVSSIRITKAMKILITNRIIGKINIVNRIIGFLFKLM